MTDETTADIGWEVSDSRRPAPDLHKPIEGDIIRVTSGQGRITSMNLGKIRFAGLAGILIASAGIFAGCASKGPAEQAGQSIDRSVQNVKDTVSPPGPVEKVGRAVDKTVNP